MRNKNLALAAFADTVVVPGCRHDQETIAGGAVLRWLVALGDYCDCSEQSAARYREACDRLVTDETILENGGPFAQWVQFRALHDRYVYDWNTVPANARTSEATKERFTPFFRAVCDYIEAGKPTLVAEHMNVLAFASRFEMVDTFGKLGDRLEQAWRRHNGGESPDYTDTEWFDSDFDSFRKWRRLSVDRRRVNRDTPSTIPNPADLSEYRFMAVDADGREWTWNDDQAGWIGGTSTRVSRP